MSHMQLCLCTKAEQTAGRGKHEGCCGVQERWEKTENTMELVKPQQANEGLSLSAVPCVSLSPEMKTPPAPVRQRTRARRGMKTYSPLYKETFKRLLSKAGT